MKMVKSLILGTAVAFAATAGAQAADLPVKAKPVSYVKICPQYGPGFYYIPGTDICLRVGGLVFAEAGYHSAGAITTLAATAATHTESELNWRSRGYLILDARQNTAYGTLRSYILGGFQQRNNTSAGLFGQANTQYGVQADGFVQYAFIQFAGFTAGLANSFFDFGSNYLVTSVTSNPWTWTNLFAYTANFGNGLSATISLEDASTTRMGTTNLFANVGHYVSPDVVANIRLDQAWGSAQVMAAAHQTRLAEGNEWGWAVGAGVEIKLPMLGAGDTIKFIATTAEGATAYTGIDNTPNGAIAGVTVGFDGLNTVITDHAGALNTQTEAESYIVQFRHFWTPTLRSSFHAGYNGTWNATAGQSVQIRQIGHSLAWSPVKDLTLSLDVLYTEIDVNNTGDTDRVASWFRITRTF
jgi:hypothetical protein